MDEREQLCASEELTERKAWLGGSDRRLIGWVNSGRRSYHGQQGSRVIVMGM